jgi:hypothetical protein
MTHRVAFWTREMMTSVTDLCHCSDVQRIFCPASLGSELVAKKDCDNVEGDRSLVLGPPVSGRGRTSGVSLVSLVSRRVGLLNLSQLARKLPNLNSVSRSNEKARKQPPGASNDNV